MADKKGPAFQSVREGGSFLRLSVGRISLKSNFEGTLVMMFLLMSAFTEQKMEQMMHHKSTLS